MVEGKHLLPGDELRFLGSTHRITRLTRCCHSRDHARDRQRPHRLCGGTRAGLHDRPRRYQIAS